MPRRPSDDLVIDIQLEEVSRSSPALGQVDNLLKQSLLETQSLQVVRSIIVRSMLGRAQVTGVEKLSGAVALRDKQRQLPASTDAPRHQKPRRKKYRERRPYAESAAILVKLLATHPAGLSTTEVAKHLNYASSSSGSLAKLLKKVAVKANKGAGPGITSLWMLKKTAAKGVTRDTPLKRGGSRPIVRQKERFAKTHITGPRLMLYLLEHLHDEEYRSNDWMMEQLRAEGKAGRHIERLSGSWGLMTLEKLATRDGTTYLRTPAGREYALALRRSLEANHEVIPGQYLAPENFNFNNSKRRHAA